ncbi:hypothetical protein HN51_065182 [Arachis hypogaea]|uniref:pre-mRNA-splicing factor CWC25 homolog n=1 Tax=Arachis ipaensis TaxID=130454 RepID=UPI0007AF290E|nr:pre-mRNA-splicing factor CWC25 homolog [Arachis ipaensis]XP_025646139.1 pre-mRNA-splicing factor CWC25 homolog [Arachis hypogaea]QHO06316.1 uncharacterized protein DS421_14g453620 [Arachis hypogaea]
MALKFLNKKGWHTGSLRNIENVWKAEQKHDAEQKKLEELRKQIHEERERNEFRLLQEKAGLVPAQERLDFLYDSGLSVGRSSNNEGFKALEAFPKPDASADAPSSSASASASKQPGALFEDKPQSANDSWRKLHSDPLLMIRQREQEALAKIKNNPVKMAMIKKSVEETEHKEKGHSKKEKRKKHHSSKLKLKRHSDSEDDTTERRKRKAGDRDSDRRHHKSLSDSEYDSSEEESKRRKSRFEDKKYKEKMEFDSSEEERRRKSHYEDKKYRERSPDHHHRERKDCNDEAERSPSHHQRHRKDYNGKRDDKNYNKSERYASERQSNSDAPAKRVNNGSFPEPSLNRSAATSHERESHHRRRYVAPKLSEEERAAKLKQMQLAAELHEEQRWKRIKKAEETDAREATQNKNSGGRNFLDDAQKSVYGAAEGGSKSIAESVRRRTHYSQGRSGGEGNAFRR